MSIIERVAGLIEPLDQAARKPVERIEPAQIERAVNKVSGDFKVRSLPERPAGKASEMLAISRDHLRRQNIITPDGNRTPNAEGFRRIKRQILANMNKVRAGVPLNLVMVTSALTGEGKTFCAVSLAISMALELDRTVLLVDADVAKPSVPDTLGVQAERGLLDVLQDRRIDLAEVLCKTDIGKLTFLPAGTRHPHATELLASDAMRSLLKQMAERYHDRVLIFDSPPLLAASEAGVLAGQMGQIIVVVEAGRTSEAALKAALARIDTKNVTGMLLNKGEDPGLRHHYGEYGKLAK